MNDDTLNIHVTVPSTMAAGRNTLHNGLLRWGCSNIDDIVLVFAELVTNATVHTADASTTVITHIPPNLRIAVHDSSHANPELRHDAGPGGFGLRIVNQLSDSWGWDQTPTGKVVWSIVPCGHLTRPSTHPPLGMTGVSRASCSDRRAQRPDRPDQDAKPGPSSSRRYRRHSAWRAATCERPRRR